MALAVITAAANLPAKLPGGFTSIFHKDVVYSLTH